MTLSVQHHVVKLQISVTMETTRQKLALYHERQITESGMKKYAVAPSGLIMSELKLVFSHFSKIIIIRHLNHVKMCK